MKIVNFFDITLNLNDNSYKSLSKTNAILTYINVSFASIVKWIPNTINNRINMLSSSKNIFNNHKESYNEALYNSGYKNELFRPIDITKILAIILETMVAKIGIMN